MDIEKVILGDFDPMKEKGSDEEREAENDDSGPEDTYYVNYNMIEN